MQQVQVKINEQGALRNGRHAFSNRYTLVTELLQNARRAGASVIHVECDAAARTLAVSDDGNGIEDFQKLLTINESGWPDEVVLAESAFGVGFSKCLYAAERVTVHSHGRCLSFETEKALERLPLDVVASDEPNHKGTKVHLEGVDIAGLDARFESLVRGFPVRVVYNDVEQERRHCADTLPVFETPIGLVHLAGYASGRFARTTVLYLQGFQVGHDRTYDCERCNVVHLEPSRFLARLPDRCELIDADQQQHLIDATLKSLWRDALVAAKEASSAEDFAETFFGAACHYGHADLFNDMAVLPRQVCAKVTGYPILGGDEDCRERLKAHPGRADVECGNVLVVDAYLADDDNLVSLMYAKARGYVLVDTNWLHEEHWVHPYVRHLDDEEASVEAIEPTECTEFDGRWVCPIVQLCERFAIRHGSDRVEIIDEAMYHEDTAYYPSGASGGQVVRQITEYLDEYDHFVESDCDADQSELADLVRRLRSVDPVSTLESLLRGLSLQRYPLLAGKTFRLSVGQPDEPPSIELVI